MFRTWCAIKKGAMVPIPISINYIWSFGSLLGLSLIVQVISGLLLAFNYTASTVGSFDSVIHICMDVQGGWLLRSVHANGASMYFILMYTHIARGIYFGGYKSVAVWVWGVTVYIMSIGVAFLGYVLPWGQMSLWGATVITNLLSAVPYVGLQLVVWLWGGFSVGSPTLIRFFCLHFILPFVILVLVIIHVLSLHLLGSSNPLGLGEQTDKIAFHPYFVLSDLMSMTFVIGMFSAALLICPDMFIDPDNFIAANPIVTPPHIQPEWYFLFAYTILRSVPSNLGGVFALILSIGILYAGVLKERVVHRYWVANNLVVVCVFTVFFLLTWVGAMPAAYPLVELGNALSCVYFVSMFMWIVM